MAARIELSLGSRWLFFGLAVLSVVGRPSNAEVLAHPAAWDLKKLDEPHHVEPFADVVSRTASAFADVFAQDRNLQFELLDAVAQECDLGAPVVTGASGDDC
ncbi:MAG: hypothetical protein V3T05_05180 [Myxococcota bacterium]